MAGDVRAGAVGFWQKLEAAMEWPRPFALGLVALALILFAVHAGISPSDYDEVVYLHASWLVSQGERPYVDFFDHHPPTLSWVLSPLAGALAPSPRALTFAARMVHLLLMALLFLGLHRWGGKGQKGPHLSWVAVVLFGAWHFVRNAIEVRPDPFMHVLAMLGMLAFFSHMRASTRLEGPRPFWPGVTSGLGLGLSMVFMQKAALFALLLFLAAAALAMRRPFRRPIVLRGMVLVAAGMAPVFLGFVALLWGTGIAADYHFWNFAFNRHLYLNNPADAFSVLPNLARAMIDAPLLWGLGLWGGFLAARDFSRSAPNAPEDAGDEHPFFALVLVVGMLVFLFQSGLPYPHNLLLIFVPLALLAARAFQTLSPGLRHAAWILGLLWVAKNAVLVFTYVENSGHRAVQDAALSVSSAEETVSIPPPFHPIFRKDAHYLWYNAGQMRLALDALCKNRDCPPQATSNAMGAAGQEDPAPLLYLPSSDALFTRSTKPPPGYMPEGGVPGLFRFQGTGQRKSGTKQ
jgi:hypothetical protein